MLIISFHPLLGLHRSDWPTQAALGDISASHIDKWSGFRRYASAGDLRRLREAMCYRDMVIARQMKKAAMAGTEAKMISCIPSEAVTRQISDIPMVS